MEPSERRTEEKSSEHVNKPNLAYNLTLLLSLSLCLSSRPNSNLRFGSFLEQN